MTADEISAALREVRDGDAAEASVNPGVLARVKAGLAARRRLGAMMEPRQVYGLEAAPATVWAVGPDGLAVEVQPVSLSAVATPPALNPDGR